MKKQTENYHKTIIIFKDGVAKVPKEVAEIMNTFNKVDEEIIHEVDFEETWESIKELFIKDSDHKNNISDIDAHFVFEWLSENYNVPTKK